MTIYQEIQFKNIIQLNDKYDLEKKLKKLKKQNKIYLYIIFLLLIFLLITFFLNFIKEYINLKIKIFVIFLRNFNIFWYQVYFIFIQL